MAVNFAALCAALRVPAPVPEYRFHPARRWRFDFCWPTHRLALEVQGAIFTQGRHTRGAALLKEFEKLNAAATLGYRVLFCTPTQIANGEAVQLVEAALQGQGLSIDAGTGR